MKKLAIGLLSVLILFLMNACGPKEKNTAAEGEVPSPTTSNLNIVKVTVKELAYERFEHFFQANGSIEAVNQAYISPEINGQIKKIHVKEGQRVSRGQRLASLNSDIIKNSIAEVKSALYLADTIYKKRDGLWKQHIGSEVEYLQAKTNKESMESRLKGLEAQLEMAEIKSPIDGIVDHIAMKEGELALPGMELLLIVNLDEVYVRADISESFVSKIHKGDIVEVSVPSYPEMTIRSAVHRIGNIIKRENRTFLLELILKNKDEKLKPNMLTLVKIKDYISESALVVPSIIIKNDMTGAYVYIVEKTGNKTIAKKIYVKTGLTQGGNTVVTKGLKPGHRIVIDGYNLIKDGIDVSIEG